MLWLPKSRPCLKSFDYITNMFSFNFQDRGIFLDLSKVSNNIVLKPRTFTSLSNLRYLKIYDSNDPRKCKQDFNLNFPHGLKLPLKKLRYLHWVKFPLDELPSDFWPDNLVDLRLPHSNITRLWEGVKVCFHVPNLYQSDG